MELDNALRDLKLDDINEITEIDEINEKLDFDLMNENIDEIGDFWKNKMMQDANDEYGLDDEDINLNALEDAFEEFADVQQKFKSGKHSGFKVAYYADIKTEQDETGDDINNEVLNGIDKDEESKGNEFNDDDNNNEKGDVVKSVNNKRKDLRRMSTLGHYKIFGYETINQIPSDILDE
eukprot:Mrub_11779.p1 GENE.Mrub_11779~~Mrub_11779.p1  ORF type:complete len:191 (+),score=67.50 Mrub_11779:37-573(+)